MINYKLRKLYLSYSVFLLQNFRDTLFWFVNRNYPWFVRGADFPLGTETGVFAMNNTYGKSNNNYSFRKFIMIKETLVN